MKAELLPPNLMATHQPIQQGVLEMFKKMSRASSPFVNITIGNNEKYITTEKQNDMLTKWYNIFVAL